MTTDMEALECFYGCGDMEKIGEVTFRCPMCQLKVRYHHGRWIRIEDRVKEVQDDNGNE